MINQELNKLQQPVSLAEVNKQHLNLQPYVELAQHIMNASVCEVNIMDAYYQDMIANKVDEAVYKDIICHNATRQNGEIHEIEDLTNNEHYNDHSYVKNPPYFRYFCSAKLATKSGRNIGSIYVLDTKPKCVSNEQKEQLRKIASSVMNAIENENRYKGILSKLEAMSESFHKLNHDVRIPISGIVGLTDLLIEEENKSEFPVQELAMIKESAETILNVIDEVLEDAKTSNNGHEKQKSSSMRMIIEQLKHLYHPPAKAKELSLTFTNQVDSNLTLPHSFALKLLQIIGNLLSNSVKFTPENGIIEVSIAQETDVHKNILRITVMDNGKGMTSEQITTFNEGDAVTRSAGTNGERSFGKGLTYIKQLVDQAGGTISAKVGENNGTKFSISLPVPVDTTNTDNPMTSLPKEFMKPKSNGVK